MKIFIVIHHECDDDTVVGVFESKLSAENFMDSRPAEFSEHDHGDHIEEWELNSGDWNGKDAVE
jgi:hypothetical protein